MMATHAIATIASKNIRELELGGLNGLAHAIPNFRSILSLACAEREW